MIKAIALVKRKPGLSREDYIKYYEEVHEPFALKNLPTLKRYVRNYIIPPRGVEQPDIDCITEMWFDDMEGLRAAMDMQSEAVLLVQEDANSFGDPSKFRLFRVDERVSE